MIECHCKGGFRGTFCERGNDSENYMWKWSIRLRNLPFTNKYPEEV